MILGAEALGLFCNICYSSATDTLAVSLRFHML